MPAELKAATVVYVHSVDTELIGTVEQASGGSYPVEAVGDWDELASLVRMGHCRILLLDVDVLGLPVEKALAALEGLGKSLVVLLATPRADATRLMSAPMASRVHRLLVKPSSVGNARRLLASAIQRYLKLSENGDHFLAEIIAHKREKQAQASTRARGIGLASLLRGDRT
jgi:DNA-binding NtrC family response regulator